MRDKRLSHGLNTDQTPIASVFRPRFIRGSSHCVVGMPSWQSNTPGGCRERAQIAQKTSGSQAVPIDSQSVPIRSQAFPNAPKPLFIRFRLKRIPFSRELSMISRKTFLREAKFAAIEHIERKRGAEERESRHRVFVISALFCGCSTSPNLANGRKSKRPEDCNPERRLTAL
jgi:hypothetical protein